MEPIPKRIAVRIRVLIALINLLQRIINSRAFRRVFHIVLKPILRVWIYTFLSRLAFGYTPKRLAELDPKAAAAIAQLEETRRNPIRAEVTDREYAALQATTWGTAGVALVIEVAIATSSKTLGPGMSIAAGCFAAVIPPLMVFGIIQSHHYDSKKDRPTTAQEMINLMAMIYGTQFFFCVGITAMLYDFDRLVAIAFLCGCWLALRILRKYSMQIVAVPTIPKVIAMTEKPLPPEPDAPETNEEEMRRMLKDNARLNGAVIPAEPAEGSSGDDKQ
jgi:hypothetical protein